MNNPEGMPWLSLFMALLSFILTKNKTGDTKKALAAGALTGLGTYYVTHETDWGKANLGSLDGVTTAVPLTNKAGTPVVDPKGNTVMVPRGSTVEYTPDGTVKVNSAGVPSVITTTGEVLKSWGGTGTAAVVGTTKLASGVSGNAKSWLPWLIGGAVVILLVKKS